jgi:hypothetical protein
MEPTEQYPNGDWPDWFREVVEAAKGGLRAYFRTMSLRYQTNIGLILDPDHDAGLPDGVLLAGC